jgi:hypothetical protein
MRSSHNSLCNYHGIYDNACESEKHSEQHQAIGNHTRKVKRFHLAVPQDPSVSDASENGQEAHAPPNEIQSTMNNSGSQQAKDAQENCGYREALWWSDEFKLHFLESCWRLHVWKHFSHLTSPRLKEDVKPFHSPSR